MSKIVPSFFALFTLLLLVFYVYAVYGIFFFRGLAARVLQDGVPPGTAFSTMGNSFVALFQMLTGANWDEIMYPMILATDWITTW